MTYAAQHVGFFYVKNYGISQEEVDRQFALGREFYDLPLDEKLQYHNLEDLHNGEYNGYRPAGLRQYVSSKLFLCPRPLLTKQTYRDHQGQRPGLQPSQV